MQKKFVIAIFLFGLGIASWGGITALQTFSEVSHERDLNGINIFDRLYTTSFPVGVGSLVFGGALMILAVWMR